MRPFLALVLLVTIAGAFQTPAPTSSQTPPAHSTFDTAVKPLLTKSCVPCHNDRLASGSLNLTPFSNPASMIQHREEWERIIQKVRTGEMPPKGIPKPPTAQVEALMGFV